MRWEPGDHVVVRDVWQGVVLTGRPETVVSDEDDLTALFLAAGTKWMSAPEYATRTEGYERAAAGDLGKRAERTWRVHHRLMLMRPGDAYSVMGFWRESDRAFMEWYVNMQAPFERTSIGFDTMDHVIDIVVARALGAWQWKDLDEAEKVVELGLASRSQLDEVRGVGESVIAMLERGEAWWTDWRDFAPDPSWPIPALPDGWDAR